MKHRKLFRGVAAAPRAALLLLLCASAHAENGPFEISRINVPYTITNAGSYVVTEDISQLNGQLVALGAAWKFLDDGSDQGTAWYATNFDDSAWSNGVAEFGYGDGDEATVVSFGGNAANKHETTYFRHAFVISNKSGLVHMDMFVQRDDGIAVYLNGVEVLRDNLPGGATYTTLATTNNPDVTALSDPEATYNEYFVSQTNLVNGTNILAAEVHQFAVNSADLSFDLALHAYTNGSGNPTNAITVAVDNASIDLRHHVLTGSEVATQNGIEVLPGVRNVSIRNGTLINWGFAGVNAEFATNCLFQHVRAIRNFRDGINAGDAAAVLDCLAAHNGQTAKFFERGDGIVMGDGSVASRCILFGNYNHGILARSSCDISDIISTLNSHDFLHGGQGEVVTRMIAAYSPVQIFQAKRGDGIEINEGSVVTDSIALGVDDGMKTRDTGRAIMYRCTAMNNYNDGLKMQDGGLFTHCVALSNADDGITMAARCAVFNNISVRNGFGAGGTPGGGINLEGQGNYVAYNHVSRNEYGISSPTGVVNNLIVANSAHGNTLTNWQIAGGNLYATNTVNPQTTRPWVNFHLR